MNGVNRVFVGGNLTRDPELRYTPQGSAVVNFSIAMNRIYTTQAGERKEEVEFMRIVVWGKRAEVCSKYLSKGRSVLVEGRLATRSWEGQDGAKKTVTEVIAQQVHFLGGQKGTAGENDSSIGLTKEAGLNKDELSAGADFSSGNERQEFLDASHTSEGDKPPF